MICVDTVTVPNALTLLRLIGSPLILPLLFAYLLPFDSLILNICLSIVFIFFSGTDFFDGYLARKHGQVSPLGSILDPIADKFLVYSSLIGILAAGKIYFYWVIWFIGREFFVMGLRHIAVERGVSLPVSFWAKVKTALQMTLIVFLILNPYQHLSWGEAPWWHVIELILLICTLVVSFWTAYFYYQDFIKGIGGYGQLFGTGHDKQSHKL